MYTWCFRTSFEDWVCSTTLKRCPLMNEYYFCISRQNKSARWAKWWNEFYTSFFNDRWIVLQNLQNIRTYYLYVCFQTNYPTLIQQYFMIAFHEVIRTVFSSSMESASSQFIYFAQVSQWRKPAHVIREIIKKVLRVQPVHSHVRVRISRFCESTTKSKMLVKKWQAFTPQQNPLFCRVSQTFESSYVLKIELIDIYSQDDGAGLHRCDLILLFR